MPSFSLLLLLLSLSLSSHFSLLHSITLPSLPHPIPTFPLPLPTTPTTSATPSTIPAFPEQSEASSAHPVSSSCPLSLPTDLLTSLSRSCSDASSAACCPTISAALHAAFAPSALSLPAASASTSLPLPDLPALPDDSESCAGQLEKSLRAKGVDLPRVNDTCDVAYCYCGVRLRRLTCAGGGGFVADEKAGSWRVRDQATGRWLERECRRPGVAGCSRCLRALNELNPKNFTNNSNNDRECQMMGLSWLLYMNRTFYLPTATSVLRALMAVPESGNLSPTTCSLPYDEMPFAVGSNEINGKSSMAVRSSSTLSSTLLLLITTLIFNIFL